MSNRNIIYLITLTFFVVFMGVLGYCVIENWSIADSMYMTVITLTTTGFREVHKLSVSGQYFTMFLLIIGVGIVTFAFTQAINSIISIDFMTRKRRKMEAKINKLNQHTIVCGFGRMGKIICKELSVAKLKFVIIEKSPQLILDLEKSDYLWMEGDAADDNNLIKLGIKRAKVITSVIDNDADGLFLSLAARTLNPDIHIIVRASNHSSQKKMIMAGANKVILPLIMSGTKVAQSIINPNIEDFFEISDINSNTEQRIQLVDIEVKKYSKLEGRTLKNCGILRDGLIVLGIKNPRKAFVFAPDSDYEFQIDDCLMALATIESYERTLKILS